MAISKAILDAADVISEVRGALEKIRGLAEAQKQLADTIDAVDKRVQNLEGRLDIARAEIKLEAVKETQAIVNSVQGGFYDRLTTIAERLGHLERQAVEVGDGAANPPQIADGSGAGTSDD